MSLADFTILVNATLRTIMFHVGSAQFIDLEFLHDSNKQQRPRSADESFLRRNGFGAPVTPLKGVSVLQVKQFGLRLFFAAGIVPCFTVWTVGCSFKTDVPPAAVSTKSDEGPSAALPYEFEPLGDSHRTLLSLESQEQRLEKLIVLNTQRQPIAGAEVLIGSASGSPFQGNVLQTGPDGSIDVPTDWIDSQTVTIQAPQFVRASWLQQSPTSAQTARIYTLRRTFTPTRIELTGTTTGYTNLTRDGVADVGVVFPALKREQLTSIQMSDLISSESDTLRVAGQSFQIPSNISIPRQQERYIITVTLNKPTYRAYFNEARAWRVVTTHVRFPFEDVVDHLRSGKSFNDALNFFEFKGSSTRDFNLTLPRQSSDLPVGEVAHSPIHTVQAPQFGNQYSLLALSVIQSAGLLYPTDVKILAPNERRTLMAPQGALGYLVAALRDKNAKTSGALADAMSVSITPNNQTTAFQIFPLPVAPQPKGQTLTLSPPQTSLIRTVTPALTYATLNKVTQVSSGSIPLESKQAIWDLYAPGWVQSLSLPSVQMPIQGQKSNLRWEVAFAAAPQGTPVALNPEFVESVSHITKSATDL